MNILMLTNTYLPHVGGVARSVEAFAAAYRRRGHRVLIVAPEFPDMPAEEQDVVRVPALQKFNGSDFSVRLPVPGLLSAALQDFQPDVIHAHHPFLLGDTAQRLAAQYDVPLVFTHHTMYEQYTHYVPGDSPALKRFAIELAVGYCNLCDRVIAPSESVAAVLRQRGVDSKIEVIPTGVDVARFAHGDGPALRQSLGIPADSLLIGHVGRLAPEKNLPFLTRAVGDYLRKDRAAHLVVVGGGPSQADLQRLAEERRLAGRVHLLGTRQGQELVDVYRAMDVFVFASQSETQGMVLTEAMAAGTPVIAVDASGAREVVQDGKNGRLLPSQNRRSFTEALVWLRKQSPEQRTALRQAALQTAEQFSIDATADRALALYEQISAAHQRGVPAERSGWEAAQRLIEIEWEMWSNLAQAVGASIGKARLWRPSKWGRVRAAYRNIRRWLTRSHWGAWLLRLPKSTAAKTEPGLVLVQIDGLSRQQLERALRKGKLPFLKRLMKREHYRLHTMYSGIPSTTPAVQGEIFYGVEQAVPAFGFSRRGSREIVRMIDPVAAEEVQSRLAVQGLPLLIGGSAYSNIYSGGAAEPHFCAAAMGWGELLRYANPLAAMLFLLTNAWSLARTCLLALWELVLAIYDCTLGIQAGQNLAAELKAIPSRVMVSVLLRDIVTIGGAMDIGRGLPLVHVNYLGYDEQAHRRGPSSRFAHWTLKGIDGSIRKLWNAIRRSAGRDYQIWIYSDHGQEHSIPYQQEFGRTIQEAVAAAFDNATEAKVDTRGSAARGDQSQRVQYLGGRLPPKLVPRARRVDAHIDPTQIIVAAIGPLGHIYLPHPLSREALQQAAERLAHDGSVPLVMLPAVDGQAVAFNGQQWLRLPGDAAQALGGDHPFLEQAAHDLARLCHHPDAGDLVFSGWRTGQRPLSFVLENGAHAGPGSEETKAFALLPRDAPLAPTEQDWFRPSVLRQAALSALGHAPRPSRRSGQPVETLRIVTYNVHSCRGMDGKLSPGRIARVLAQWDPTIVALQELDVRRLRSDGVDQAHAIAAELEMEFHFHPAMSVEEERYGDAILSRLPMRLVKAGPLPGDAQQPTREPRGAIWVTVEFQGRQIQIINTHLGLSGVERLAQVEALLGPEWLGHPDCQGPVILCGDFNALPRTGPYKKIRQTLADAQLALNGHRPRRTFSSHYPVGRIDHVFLGNGLSVVSIDVPRSQLASMASDHLPLVVDLALADKPKK
ncbi:MAG: glycosyltransferase [Pirellulales bacterium]